MIWWLAMQADASGFDLARFPAVPKDCASGADLVICGHRPDRHRLPLPRATPAPDVAPGASGMTAITPPGRCGLFAGERRCPKREALDYGYGGGRDPLTVIVGAVGAIVDPDR